MLAKGARAFFLLWEVYTEGHKKIHRAFFFLSFLPPDRSEKCYVPGMDVCDKE